MKLSFLLFGLTFFGLCDYLHSASVEVNVQLATTTAEISVQITSLSVAFQTAQITALYQDSEYVRSVISELSTKVEEFSLEVQACNARYQTQTEFVAATGMRESLANIISYLGTFLHVATQAEIAEVATVTTEINAVIKIFESFRAVLAVFTTQTSLTSVRLISQTLSDKRVTEFTTGLSRSSEVIILVVNGLVTRITEDSDFASLVFSLDFQTAVQTGNTVAANIAITSQSRYYEVVSRTTTTAAYTVLNGDIVVYDSFDPSLIVEFNVLGVYAQTRVNGVINLIVRLLVSTTTVEQVYEVLGQEILAGLAEAFRQIRAEFQIAIDDCKAEIDSPEPGGNGSESSSESEASSDSDGDGGSAGSGKNDDRSMKGEVKKCSKRGRGLMLLIQAQYSKSSTAAVCGAASIAVINAQVAIAQSRIGVCVNEAIVNYRLVLEEVKALIRTEIDVNVDALRDCAQESSGSSSGGEVCIPLRSETNIEGRSGSKESSKETSKEKSKKCTKKIDKDFKNLVKEARKLIKRLQKGGKYRKEAKKCRLEARESLVENFSSVRASFSSCSGVQKLE